MIPPLHAASDEDVRGVHHPLVPHETIPVQDATIEHHPVVGVKLWDAVTADDGARNAEETVPRHSRHDEYLQV